MAVSVYTYHCWQGITWPISSKYRCFIVLHFSGMHTGIRNQTQVNFFCCEQGRFFLQIWLILVRFGVCFIIENMGNFTWKAFDHFFFKAFYHFLNKVLINSNFHTSIFLCMIVSWYCYNTRIISVCPFWQYKPFNGSY